MLTWLKVKKKITVSHTVWSWKTYLLLFMIIILYNSFEWHQPLKVSSFHLRYVPSFVDSLSWKKKDQIQWLPWCCLLECVQTLNFITKHKCVTYKQWRSNCNIFSNTGSQIHYLNTVASNIYYSNLISCHSSPFFGSSDPPPL